MGTQRCLFWQWASGWANFCCCCCCCCSVAVVVVCVVDSLCTTPLLLVCVYSLSLTRNYFTIVLSFFYILPTEMSPWFVLAIFPCCVNVCVSVCVKERERFFRLGIRYKMKINHTLPDGDTLNCFKKELLFGPNIFRQTKKKILNISVSKNIIHNFTTFTKIKWILDRKIPMKCCFNRSFSFVRCRTVATHVLNFIKMTRGFLWHISKKYVTHPHDDDTNQVKKQILRVYRSVKSVWEGGGHLFIKCNFFEFDSKSCTICQRSQINSQHDFHAQKVH